MKSFEIVSEDGKIKHIYDLRYEEKVDITNGKGNFGCVCYTLRNEDVNAMPKRNYMPHAQHFADVIAEDDEVFVNAQCGVTFQISSENNGLKLHWQYSNALFSKFAAYLPLNLMSQKNGYWENQLQISSPCYDPETKTTTCMFTRPDGNHLMLVVKTPTAAFRIDYGTHVHFMDGFEIVENLDKTYGCEPRDNGEIIAYLVPVQSYEEGLKVASEILDVPCAYYQMSSVQIGENFPLNVAGKCDEIHLVAPDGEKTVYSGSSDVSVPTKQYGFYQVIPYCNGKRGVSCQFFAHYDWQTMYLNSIESVPVHKDMPIGNMKDGTPVWMPPFAQYRGYIDTNLCEHTMWAWSQLQYMRHHSVSKTAEENVMNLLNVLLADDVSAYRPRQTLISSDQDEPKKICSWNTYKSDRIQEAFNGASVLLAAWKTYGQRRYLECAVDVIDTLLTHNLRDGCIIRNAYDPSSHDYTTVTALILPVVDLYRELNRLTDPRMEKFYQYAEQIADFLVRRGMDFPTETIKNDAYGKQYEDGSVSCTALTVAYVAHYVVNKPAYIEFARQVLRRHDAFCVYTNHPVMYHSSLRWWENLWEGDTDGPAICCGHAWSIWRAEAEFWLALESMDAVRLRSSYNGYMSNFSKQDQEGNMYSLYQCEPCISGAYSEAKDVSRRFAIGFPAKKDTTLSRYVYARGYDTWLSTTAVLPDGTVLNGKIVNGELKSNAFRFSKLYLEPLPAPLSVSAIDEVEIYCRKPITCIKGKIVNRTEFSVVIKPSDDGELVLATT